MEGRGLIPSTQRRQCAIHFVLGACLSGQLAMAEYSRMFYGDFKDQSDYEFLQSALIRLEKIFGKTYYGDNNILLGRICSFLEDERFQASLHRQSRTSQEKSLVFRLNTLVWGFSHALKLEGDIVECGVWRAFLFGFLTDYFEFKSISNKKVWLYDTYAGIPPDYDTEQHDHALLHEKDLYEKVILRFREFDNVNVVRGVVPSILMERGPAKISMLHLDLNSSRAEVEALNVLFDRVVSGGLVIFDDFGWTGYEAQHRAETAWAAARDYRILELPTGQGLLLKR